MDAVAPGMSPKGSQIVEKMRSARSLEHRAISSLQTLAYCLLLVLRLVNASDTYQTSVERASRFEWVQFQCPVLLPGVATSDDHFG